MGKDDFLRRTRTTMTWNNNLQPTRPATGHRFFGGPPTTVLVRLVFASLVVGALLMWLNVEPIDVVRSAVRLAERLWDMGFEAFGQAGRYVLAGAVIVVPIWLVMRLMTFRGR